jgi:ketosteroid isomerase-like protein
MYYALPQKGNFMKKVFTVAGVMLLLTVFALCGVWANAEAVQSLESMQSQAELDKAITTLDAAVFDAYNRCDLEKFSSFFSDDVEFYHDQGGVTLGKADLTDSVMKNICGKVTRELVAGTLQTYHMKGYGAVEMGVHRFRHPGHEDTEPVGEGKFIHLWRYKDGAWKITRVISYDHHAAAK